MVMGSSSQQQGVEKNDQKDGRTDPSSHTAGIPPPGVIRSWQEVANGIDRSQTGTVSLSSCGTPRASPAGKGTL